jgi:type 1 fimbria pilin
MLKKLSFLLVLALLITIGACGEYEITPRVYFDISAIPSSNAVAPGSTQTLLLQNFNTSKVEGVNVQSVKLGDIDVKNFTITRGEKSIEISYTVPAEAATFSEISVAAQGGDRAKNIISLKF